MMITRELRDRLIIDVTLAEGYNFGAFDTATNKKRLSIDASYTENTAASRKSSQSLDQYHQSQDHTLYRQ